MGPAVIYYVLKDNALSATATPFEMVQETRYSFPKYLSVSFN